MLDPRFTYIRNVVIYTVEYIGFKIKSYFTAEARAKIYLRKSMSPLRVSQLGKPREVENDPRHDLVK